MASAGSNNGLVGFSQKSKQELSILTDLKDNLTNLREKVG